MILNSDIVCHVLRTFLFFTHYLNFTMLDINTHFKILVHYEFYLTILNSVQKLHLDRNHCDRILPGLNKIPWNSLRAFKIKCQRMI